jgi:hypothetical protein
MEKSCCAETPQRHSPLVVPTSNFFAPLGAISMESSSNSMDPVAPEGSSKKFEGPPRVIVTSPVNIISLQKVFKPIPKNQFSLRTTGDGTRIVIYYMADYKAILSYLFDHNLHHFTFYHKPASSF